MNKQINMVECIRCNKEFAMEDDYGICQSCQPELEAEVAIASLHQELATLEQCAIGVVRKHKNYLEHCIKQLTKLVNNL